jgi:hypothetical protein
MCVCVCVYVCVSPVVLDGDESVVRTIEDMPCRFGGSVCLCVCIVCARVYLCAVKKYFYIICVCIYVCEMEKY